MLQHQNLIANKHSIFYRFDQKEKKDQTIEQFKIFTGLVDQNYFFLQLELSELDKKIKMANNQKQEFTLKKINLSKRLEELLDFYRITTGESLTNDKIEVILENPYYHLSQIELKEVHTKDNFNEYINSLKETEKIRNNISSIIRQLSIQLNDIDSTIKYVDSYKTELKEKKNISYPNKNINNSECPFCHSSHTNINEINNKLSDAINWLNQELEKTPYLIDSILSEKNQVISEIKTQKNNLENIENKIKDIKSIIKKLNLNRSLEEQGKKIKYKVENILEDIIKLNETNPDLSLATLKESRENVLEKLKTYNVEDIIKGFESTLKREMNFLGKKLDFEKTYNPINLNFSLNTFELWHSKGFDKTYLRSMGSGANWLYCHLCLFTAFLKLFSQLGEKCHIPPILFLDQPSQVYFPTSVDIDDNFNANELSKLANKKNQVDEDLKAVTNFYKQLVLFCQKTEQETGICPQIIITDHADNLNLELESISFETLVNDRRWRKRGFIDTSLL